MFIRTSNQQPTMTALLPLLVLPLLLSQSTNYAVSAQDVIITKTITSGPSEATASADAAEFTSVSFFTSAILNSTNTYRDQHNASHLVWNRTLEAFANRPRVTVRLFRLGPRDQGGKCDFKHSGGPYGENLALGCSNATSCVEAWGNERRDYDFGKGDFGESTGHFTQLVWKDTTSVGCGARMCGGDGQGGEDGSARGWYLVCEYWPRGNVIGKFTDEVQAQEGAGASISSRVPVTLGVVIGLACSVFTILN
ncbi:the plant PR-1 class pathogen related [Apiospora sp. TS-2023a]